MANIGSFRKSGQEYLGEIITFSLQTNGVRIVPETSRTNGSIPSHRVHADYAVRGVYTVCPHVWADFPLLSVPMSAA